VIESGTQATFNWLPGTIKGKGFSQSRVMLLGGDLLELNRAGKTQGKGRI